MIPYMRSEETESRQRFTKMNLDSRSLITVIINSTDNQKSQGNRIQSWWKRVLWKKSTKAAFHLFCDTTSLMLTDHNLRVKIVFPTTRSTKWCSQSDTEQTDSTSRDQWWNRCWALIVAEINLCYQHRHSKIKMSHFF